MFYVFLFCFFFSFSLEIWALVKNKQINKYPEVLFPFSQHPDTQVGTLWPGWVVYQVGENLPRPSGPVGGWLMARALPGGRLCVLQGFTLGPPLSYIIFNDLEGSLEFIFTVLSDDTKLGDVVTLLEGGATPRRT